MGTWKPSLGCTDGQDAGPQLGQGVWGSIDMQARKVQITD